MLSFLPNHIGIAYFEGYRPLSQQKDYFIAKYFELRKTMGSDESYKETSKYVSPFIGNTPTHCTGAAIDISLFRIDTNNLLDLGKFGTIFGPNDHSHTFSQNISKEQQTNRIMLLEAARKAGLVNYGYEWWHYSYGDKVWAYVKHKKCAIYDQPYSHYSNSITKEEFIQELETQVNFMINR